MQQLSNIKNGTPDLPLAQLNDPKQWLMKINVQSGQCYILSSEFYPMVSLHY